MEPKLRRRDRIAALLGRKRDPGARAGGKEGVSMLVESKATDFVAELAEQGVPQEAPPEWRRAEARAGVCVSVDVDVLRTTAATTPAAMRGRTLNMSSDSLAVVCRTPIVAGSRVRVTLLSGRSCEADVVHCTATVGGYKIGMKLV